MSPPRDGINCQCCIWNNKSEWVEVAILRDSNTYVDHGNFSQAFADSIWIEILGITISFNVYAEILLVKKIKGDGKVLQTTL